METVDGCRAITSLTAVFKPNHESSVAADGSLFMLWPNQVYKLNKNPDYTDDHINIFKSYVYRLLSKYFPSEAIYTPPFRFCGMKGNRLFTVSAWNPKKSETERLISTLKALYIIFDKKSNAFFIFIFLYSCNWIIFIV